MIYAPTDVEFDEASAAVDVSLNLRWPSALETSGPWLRALALGRPTIIIDLAHQGHLPVLDPRTWHRYAPTADLDLGGDARAIAVAVDILDEDHSLRLAMRRLGGDASLREQLGREARRFWEREHTVERMANDYAHAIDAAIAEPVGAIEVSASATHDVAAHARGLMAPFGLDPPRPF
jgi:hypothetical protein